MAGAARIGALHVMLGLDSAEFTAGLAKANSGLAKFSKAAKIGFAAVAVAATAAGAALSVAVKGAIDRADDLSKTAQRIGTTTEALSRLEWAAKLSDVSLSQLSTGLQRLSRNMLDVSNGVGAQAKTAFDALGIAVVDTEGKLRSSDEVFAEIADRFSRMPDSAEKTALAMQLLGRAGAEMIPLLNSGKDGLAEMAEESDRLGNTLSTKTGKAAEAFNDSITRLQTGLQGMVNRIAEAALPTLNNLINTLTSPDFMQAMQDFAIAAVAIADAIAQVFIGAHKAFKDFLDFINRTGGPAQTVASKTAPLNERSLSIMQQQLTDKEAALARSQASNGGFFGTTIGADWDRQNLRNEIADLRAAIAARSDPAAFDVDGVFSSLSTQTFDSVDDLKGALVGTSGAATGTSAVIDQLREVFETLGTGAGSAKSGVDALKQAMTEGQAVFTATRMPAEAYKIELERLNGLLQKGAIDQDTYNRAVMQAQDAFEGAKTSGNELASSLSSGLASMFSSVVDGSKSAVEAVGDLLKSLGQMLIHKGFEMLIGGIFGGGMGGGFKLPFFANGTNFAPGGLAMVGERGPELVNLPRGSKVIPNSELQMGGGHSVVAIHLADGLRAEIVSQATGQAVQITKGMVEPVSRTVSQMAQQQRYG